MHKEWLDNEYRLFVEALNASTVDNFKSHPMVIRMLGEVDGSLYPSFMSTKLPLLRQIDQIGGSIPGQMERFIYYAKMVLSKNPKHIVEIGGGCGQFYATLRALGYKGTYAICDLPEVKEFQKRYLSEVQKQTGIKIDLEDVVIPQSSFCVSLYSIGEFDDDLKIEYIEKLVSKCPHGLIVWNPHSGASKEITWKCKVEPENPLTAPNNKLCTW